MRFYLCHNNLFYNFLSFLDSRAKIQANSVSRTEAYSRGFWTKLSIQIQLRKYTLWIMWNFNFQNELCTYMHQRSIKYCYVIIQKPRMYAAAATNFLPYHNSRSWHFSKADFETEIRCCSDFRWGCYGWFWGHCSNLNFRFRWRRWRL